MDQEKIGKFIAKCRKDKHLTQGQVAEKLGVTDRSVSNLENGKCMPDLSLFQDLCSILGISINEFLLGEKIEDKNLKVKSEESFKNLVDLSNKNIRRVRIKLFLISSIVTMILLFFLVDFGSIFLFQKPVFAVKKDNKYVGLLYDTYVCGEYSVPQVKLKGIKFACSEAYVYQVETEENHRCDNTSRVELYYEEEDRKVYTKCIDNILVSYKDKVVTFDKFVKNSGSLEEAINKITLADSKIWNKGINYLWDGGTAIYSSQDLTIIKCNRFGENGKVNRDIYFGPRDMEFKENYCTFDNVSFIRTYTVENIKQADEEFSYYLTLSVYQGETVTVLVKNFFFDVSEKHIYEFEFMKIPKSKKIDDNNIEELFSNTKILSVNETTNIGMIQNQEPTF